ncbi:MAG: STAS domain-containing protein [Mycobacteriales bacterium]|nr:STAS domain-containing protein [Frankia sp.]
MATQLGIELGRSLGARTVSVRGELDIHTAPRLRKALAEAFENGDRIVVVDFADVTFMDSSGIAVLVGASKRARAASAELRVCRMTAAVRRPLETMHLESVIPVYDDLDEACEAVS